MKSDISVVIPLYNKEKEIARTLRSVLAQTSQPLEIIVVDDGSTDGSAARVEEIGSPLIRLIQQENRGVSAARNRAMQEACGEYAALLDGDDTWEPGYLAEIERLIAAYPGCGAYATSFNVDDGHHLTPGDTPQTEGVVDFFTEALSHYVLIPSSTTLRREPALSLGGFPEGMRMGEDQYLWTKLARTSRFASPRPDSCVTRKPLPTVRQPSTARNRRDFPSKTYTNPPPAIRATNTSPARHWARPSSSAPKAARRKPPGLRNSSPTPGTTGVRCASSASSTHCRPLARSAARGLQPSGLGDRPERDVTKRRDATAEAPADSRTKPPTTVLRRTKKSRHREMPGSSLCAKRKTTPLPPRPSWRYRRSPRRRPPPNARSASRRPHAPRREAPWYP